MKGLLHISIVPDFKPGDPAPQGYNNWHAWAAVQERSGIHQRWCGACGKWLYPQEDCGHDKSKRITPQQFKRLEKQVAKELAAQKIKPTEPAK